MNIQNMNLSELKKLTLRLTRNTASTVEFIRETISAETKHFTQQIKHQTLRAVAGKPNKCEARQTQDVSLDPLGGVGGDSFSS